MKRILLLIFISCLFLQVAAQKKAPKWMEKQRKAIVQIDTYGKDGNKLGSTTGFFVSENGDVLGAYEVFKGAQKATVTDVEGKVFPVESILGWDELYDVIKLKVSVPKKVVFFEVASDPVANGSTVYLLPYSTSKNIVFSQGTITEVSKLKDSYSYYKLSIPLETGQLNSPLLTEEGAVFGLAQADATGKKDVSFGVSAAYADQLSFTSTDFITTTQNSIGIKKAWPADRDQAMVALYLKGSTEDAKTYLQTLTDFIATFPEDSEGYLRRANHYAYRRTELAPTPLEQFKYLELALDDVKTAGKMGDKKGNGYYYQAELIFGVAVGDTTLNRPEWSVPVALEMVQKAIKEEDSPRYRLLEGDIYFYQQQFDKAYEDYMIVNNSDAASAASYYSAAKARQNIPGFNIGDIIQLLDKAIEKCGMPMSSDAGQYILERIDWKLRLSQYKEAVEDYDLYFTAVQGQVGANFYFYREQAKFRAGDLEGALKDIGQAILAAPDVPEYYAEEASILVRMQKYDQALESVQKALELAPDYAACLRLKGVCYIRLGKKAEACEFLTKAKELGDPVAPKLIQGNCK